MDNFCKSLQEEKTDHNSTGRYMCNMATRRRIPQETKATIKVLKATTNLSLDAIAERCGVSTASVHRIVTTTDKAPENRRHLRGRRRKLTPEHEASIFGSISELREREGSFSLRRLMEQTRSCHVSDRTVRRLLNRNGYYFLQTRKKGLMSQTDKEKSGIRHKDASQLPSERMDR